jgi:hypothetical protein
MMKMKTEFRHLNWNILYQDKFDATKHELIQPIKTILQYLNTVFIFSFPYIASKSIASSITVKVYCISKRLFWKQINKKVKYAYQESPHSENTASPRSEKEEEKRACVYKNINFKRTPQTINKKENPWVKRYIWIQITIKISNIKMPTYMFSLQFPYITLKCKG